MRRLFLVLAKLVGLLQLYWALVNFMQIGFTLSMVGRSGHRGPGATFDSAEKPSCFM